MQSSINRILIFLLLSFLAGCGQAPSTPAGLEETMVLSELDLNHDGRRSEVIRAYTLTNQKGRKNGMLKIEFNTPDAQADGSVIVETIHYPDGYPVSVTVKNDILSVTTTSADGERRQLYRYKIRNSSVYGIPEKKTNVTAH